MTRAFKPIEDIECFYHEGLKRMIISERVNITRSFNPNKEMAAHLREYKE